jgi:restriction system protein
MSTHGADQALLVAWGGVNKAAKQELRSQFFKVRVWSADEMLDALMRTYPVLDEDIRAELPLKQIWALVEEAGQRAALTIAALPEAPRGITLETLAWR